MTAAPTTAMISETEQRDFQVALLRNCCCERDSYGALTGICPGHDSLNSDPHWLSRLCFVRTLSVQLQVEEMTYGKPRVGTDALGLTPPAEETDLVWENYGGGWGWFKADLTNGRQRA